MRIRWGELTKGGDHSAEARCSPDRDRLVAGSRRALARTGRSTRASCGDSRARTGLTDLLHLHPQPKLARVADHTIEVGDYAVSLGV